MTWLTMGPLSFLWGETGLGGGPERGFCGWRKERRYATWQAKTQYKKRKVILRKHQKKKKKKKFARDAKGGSHLADGTMGLKLGSKEG